jgi:hypothetical protein
LHQGGWFLVPELLWVCSMDGSVSCEVGGQYNVLVMIQWTVAGISKRLPSSDLDGAPLSFYFSFANLHTVFSL